MREYNIETTGVAAIRQQTYFPVDAGVAEELTQVFELLQRRRLINSYLISTVDPILHCYNVNVQPRPVDRAQDFYFRSFDIERQVINVGDSEC